MTVCAVPSCKSISKKRCGIKFHNFPKKKRMKSVWYRKIKMLRPITRDSKVCSEHFTDEDYLLSASGKSMVLKQEAVPSLNLPSKHIVFDCEKRANEQKCRERLKRIYDREAQAEHIIESHGTETLTDDNTIEEVYLEENCYENEVEIERATQTNICNEQEYYDRAIQSKHSVRIEDLSEKDFKYYTGFKFSQFETLWQALMEETIYTGFDKYLSNKNQLVLSLTRYKLNLDFVLISHLYGIDRRIASEIFKYWTTVLYKYFKTINFWRLRYKNSNSYTAIIDCTEFETQRSSSDPEANQRIFSHYKNKPTLKILLAIDEKGLVIFCSDIFGGSAGDENIVQESGFYDLLNAGDIILADRSFNIGDILARKGIALHFSPFKGRQLTKHELMDTHIVANRRIHVERVRKMAKINKILTQTIPKFVWSIANEIVYVGAFLPNFKDGVV